MQRRWIVFIIFVFVVTSCNLPNQTTNTLLTTPIAVTPPQTFSTPTLIPIETLLARATSTLVPTSTPQLALASPINQPVNCRFGPSTAYSVIGSLDVDQQAEIVGKNIDETWWYVKNPSDPSTFCWLVANLIDVVGNVDLLPVVQAPLAQVTNIQVSFEPPSINVSCTAFPQLVTVNAVIFTNGPATVTWRWETSEGDLIDRNPLLFLEASSQNVFVNFKVATAKDYSIQLHILSPNDTTATAIFKATCLP